MHHDVFLSYHASPKNSKKNDKILLTILKGILLPFDLRKSEHEGREKGAKRWCHNYYLLLSIIYYLLFSWVSIIETWLNVCFLFLPLCLCLFSLSLFVDYRKITKMSPGGYIFQRPFLRGIFLEGLMYGGKFTLCFTLYSGENSKYKPPRGLILVAI